MSEISTRGYARPDVLVSTDWVANHLTDPDIRIVESNEDMLLYPSGHIPGAVQVDWTIDLNDQVRRDYIGREGFEALMSRIGATPKTTIVFYGDKNNWWACYAFWVFQLFGHTRRPRHGRRPSQVDEGGPAVHARRARHSPRRSTRPPPAAMRRFARSRNRCSRTSRRRASSWTCAAPRNTPARASTCRTTRTKGALRGGHIPGAKSIPWARAINPEDGTFKDADGARRALLARRTSSTRTSRRSRTAASASAAATRGSR